MKMVIDELVTLLGLDIAPGVLPKIQKFETMVADVARTVGKVSAALVVAASGVVAFADHMNKNSFGISKFSDLTGQSAEELQQFQAAAIAAGGSAEGAVQSFHTLLQNLDPAHVENFNTEFLRLAATVGEVGKVIKTPAEAFDYANQLLQSKSLNQNQKTQWAKHLGFDEDTAMLVMKPRAEFLEILNKAKEKTIILNKKDLKDIKEYNIQWNVLTFTVDQIGKKVSSVALPAMKELVGNFDKWIDQNQAFIESGIAYTMDGIIIAFRDLGGFISDAYKSLSGFLGIIKNGIPGGDKFVEGLKSINLAAQAVKIAFIGIGVALSSMAVQFMWANKWSFVIGAIVAIMQDAWAYFHGMPSVIGEAIKWIDEFFDKFAAKYPIVQDMVNIWNALREAIKNADTEKEKQDKEKHGGTEQDKTWGTAFGNIWDDIRYKLASPGNRAAMEQAKTKALIPNMAAPSHTITINQTINGESAMGIAHESAKNIYDILSQQHPGLFTQVVN